MPDDLCAYSAEPWVHMSAYVNGTAAWTAPRAAYLLTAAMAEGVIREGAVVPSDEMGDEWNSYDEAGQREILIALGAQTRVALKMLQEELGVQIEMDWHETERAVCPEALALAHQLVRLETGPLVMPQCAHCREIIGYGLCSLQIQSYFLLGFTPVMIAAACRQSADETAAVGA